MQADIHTFILALLSKKAPLPAGFHDDTDYISAGIIDSMAIIKFILELEAKFDIAFTDEDIETVQFRSVRGLTALIENKIV